MCGTDVISIYIFIQFMEIYQYLWMNRQSLMAILLDNLLENYASTVKPAIVTSCILKGVGVYNEYYMANLI